MLVIEPNSVKFHSNTHRECSLVIRIERERKKESHVDTQVIAQPDMPIFFSGEASLSAGSVTLALCPRCSFKYVSSSVVRNAAEPPTTKKAQLNFRFQLSGKAFGFPFVSRQIFPPKLYLLSLSGVSTFDGLTVVNMCAKSVFRNQHRTRV